MLADGLHKVEVVFVGLVYTALDADGELMESVEAANPPL